MLAVEVRALTARVGFSDRQSSAFTTSAWILVMVLFGTGRDSAQATPDRDIEARHAGLGDRRHLGQT